GLSIVCTVDAIPAQTGLPAAPVLQKASGTGKNGKATTNGTVNGDTLTMKGKLAASEGTLDFSGKDLFVRVPGMSEAQDDGTVEDHSILVRIPAGVLVAHGKKLAAKDTDGTMIRLVKGRKREGNGAAALSGSITVKQTKKGATIALKETGVDLSKLLFGASDVTVGLGALDANDAATVTQK